MSVEELIEIKEQLEKEQPYFITSSAGQEYLYTNEIEPKSLAEWKKEEQTNEVVKKCEEMIKTILRTLIKNETKFEQISIYSVPMFLCKVNKLDSLNLDHKFCKMKIQYHQ